MPAKIANFPSNNWTTVQVGVKVSAKKINTNPNVDENTQRQATASLEEIDSSNENRERSKG